MSEAVLLLLIGLSAVGFLYTWLVMVPIHFLNGVIFLPIFFINGVVFSYLCVEEKRSGVGGLK